METNYSNEVDYIIEYNKIIELCIYFDRVYYDSETIDLTLIAFAFTKKGMNYLEQLHNEWNDVRELLEPNALIKLRTNEKLNTNKLYFLDNKGNFIPYKTNSTIKKMITTINK
ncbi:MAG: hypothetical protein IJ062_03540 [Firmicutes bacterium]|nr:hypothetical protein [Bacillota bacterium]